MKYTVSILTAAGLLAGACNKKQESPDAKASAPQAEAPAFKPEYAAPDSFQVGLGKVYQGYLKIEVALAHDDLQGAKDAFQGMHAVLHTLPTEGMDTVAVTHWDSLDTRFMRVLHPMAASETIAIMRDHLADFTPLMLEAIKKFGVQAAGPVYLFHCPMARNNAGADWLQGGKTLENPFYGKSMLQCGNLVETVKL
jgi:Cu(I)/Ag(I) efflux system membrane fusion protein